MKSFFLTFWGFVFVFFTAFSQIECYTIAVGKNASATGYTMLAHNEDDGGDLIVELFRVPQLKNETVFLDTKVNPNKDTSISYLWFETTKQQFGDFVINDYGVAICSNACPSKEDTAKGLLDFDFRHLIIRQAKTAKQAVKIAAELIEKYGYNSSGRTYTFADKNEIWLFAVVKGKHYVAQRVPDDQVAIIPNYYTIDTVDLQDTANFIASADIIDYARKRGWYNPQKDKYFSFRRAYSKYESLVSVANVPRHWIGLKKLSKDETPFFSMEYPFSFYPKKRVSKEDLMEVLSSHFEELYPVDTNKALNPHKRSNIVRVCNNNTKFSLVVEYSNKLENTIIWWSPLNPCINPYLPIPLNLRQIPDNYNNRSVKEAFSEHFEDSRNSLRKNKGLAFYYFTEYNDFVNNDYWHRIGKVHSEKEKLYQDFLKKINNSENKAEVSRQILENFYNLRKKQTKKFKNGKNTP